MPHLKYDALTQRRTNLVKEELQNTGFMRKREVELGLFLPFFLSFTVDLKESPKSGRSIRSIEAQR